MSATNAAPGTWIRNPLAILADGAGGGVVVHDRTITELVPQGRVPRSAYTRVFDASEHVVLPGLINTHHHFYQTLTRAHPAAINKPLFRWLEALYPIWARLTPEALELAAKVALAELLLSGCTTAADHHYLFPPGLDNAVDIEVAAARELGIRMTVLRGSMNLSQKDGGLPPDEVVQKEDAILADCERVLGKYHDPGCGAEIQIALAPCSPFSVTPSLLRTTAELAGRYECGLHTHLAETHDENEFCLATFGCRPLDLLREAGWLAPRTWLAHGVHFTESECAELGHHGVGVCHCPTSNAVLASGFCPTAALESHGAPVGLGVDGSASNDASNMLEAVRHALMVNRLRNDDAASPTHLDALRWATEGSAACLGRDDIGRLAPGLQADIAFYKLDELRFSGAHDPLAALVLCGGHRADRVMVGGQWRVIDGELQSIDVDALRARHGKAAAAFA
ncbi:MAG: 8-oxoguanine deaminase [Pseudomonadota bacterium]